jgi:FkbM family methyltransferase
MDASRIHNKAEGDVDRVVQRRFFREDREGRVFVDIGAARPDYLSISALYRSMGWRVIAVEPNPAFCDLHRDRGYDVYQYACGDRDEDDVDFLVVDSHGHAYENGQVTYESFSSLAIKDSYATLAHDLDTTTIQVDLRRLDSILRLHAPDVDHIDILSVDVEGWELEVLDGLDVAAYRPSVMIIENLFDERSYRAHMNDLGYVLWKRLSLNDVYARNELFDTPTRRVLVRMYEKFVNFRAR